jgi:hypothetical protein
VGIYAAMKMARRPAIPITAMLREVEAAPPVYCGGGTYVVSFLVGT